MSKRCPRILQHTEINSFYSLILCFSISQYYEKIFRFTTSFTKSPISHAATFTLVELEYCIDIIRAVKGFHTELFFLILLSFDRNFKNFYPRPILLLFIYFVNKSLKLYPIFLGHYMLYIGIRKKIYSYVKL